MIFPLPPLLPQEDISGCVVRKTNVLSFRHLQKGGATVIPVVLRREEKQLADLFLGSLALYHCAWGSLTLGGADFVPNVKIKAK